MATLFSSGRVIDLVIALVVLEALTLCAYHLATGRGLAPAQFAANLAAGLCLLLAVRAALTSAGWVWVALSLALSRLAHLADLGSRLRARQSAVAPWCRLADVTRLA